MSSMVEAERAIERLNDFRLYGSKISVKLANRGKEKKKSLEARSWKQGEEKRQMEKRDNIMKQAPIENETYKMNGDQSKMQNKVRKRIKGHIDKEDLWNMRKCLVGEMEAVCIVNSIMDRLHNWGLGEIRVQRMGAKTFLLTIDDEDLFLLLEDLEWYYLKEIFSEIKPWTENVSCWGRATWLEFRGIPLHCWNSATLKNLAGLWGKFEVLGCNAYHKRDCEKSGREVAENDRSSPGSKEEALKAICMEKEINDDLNREVQNSRGLINEEELMGGNSQDLNASAKEVKDKKDNNGKG
ncbi:hypothetical protein V6N13_009840 [Hibiscus sabdariffa]